MKRTWMLPLVLIVIAPLAAAQASLVRADLPSLWLAGQALENDDAPPADRDLRVSLWHDQEEDDPYRRGQSLSVHFRTNQDLYVVVYRVDTEGAVDVLWPTTRYSDGFVYGGHVYSLPPKGSPRGLRVGNSQGVEYVEAIASRYPFDLRGLGIDFALDPNDAGDLRYTVAGDPFLAINDINFAITGLEEDADYIVTDFTHLYVESQVSHARYSCRQCHTSDAGYHPYVDTCTQVVIHRDFGWYSRWRANYAWYPLYCDPPYYYWDLTFHRPYVNWYYPVAYSWSSWNCYTRPYPIYWWHDSPRYAGNHLVRYRNGSTRTGPLWDSERRRDGRTRTPAGMRVADVRRGRDERVDESLIVRGAPPARRMDERSRPVEVRTADRDRTVERTPRTGIRTNQTRERGLVSQRPLDARTPRDVPRVGAQPRVTPSERTGRTWTRPVVRNTDPQPRTEAPVIREGNRQPSRPSPTPEVRNQPRTPSRPPQTVQPRTRETAPSKPPVVKPRTERKPEPRQAPTVKRRDSKGGGGGGGAVQPRVTRSQPTPRSVKPSAPARPPVVKRSAPAPRPTPSVRKPAPAKSAPPAKATPKQGSGGKTRSKGSGGRSGGGSTR